MTRSTGPYALLAAAALLLALIGCADQHVEFVDSGRSYTASTVGTLIEMAPPGDLASRKTAEAPALRQRALTSLRRTKGRASQAAELLTTIFPGSTTAVPYYVERATYENADAWIVLEARGRTDGALSDRRLWVIDTKGSVIVSRLR